MTTSENLTFSIENEFEEVSFNQLAIRLDKCGSCNTKDQVYSVNTNSGKLTVGRINTAATGISEIKITLPSLMVLGYFKIADTFQKQLKYYVGSTSTGELMCNASPFEVGKVLDGSGMLWYTLECDFYGEYDYILIKLDDDKVGRNNQMAGLKLYKKITPI